MKFASALRYGLIAFILTAGFCFVAYLLYKTMFSSLTIASISAFLVVGTIVFLAVWAGVTMRRKNGGFISFFNAFQSAFIVASMAALSWGMMAYLLPNVLFPEKPREIVPYVQEIVRIKMARQKVAQAEIDKTVNEITLDAYTPALVTVAEDTVAKLIWAALLSLLLAAFIKRNSQIAGMKDGEKPDTGN